MASAISFTQAPGNLAINSLKPGIAESTSTVFVADGDNSQTLSCSFSHGDYNSGDNSLILYKDVNPGDTDFIEASLSTTGCNDETVNVILLTLSSGDTNATNIGKTYQASGEVTLALAYQ